MGGSIRTILSHPAEQTTLLSAATISDLVTIDRFVIRSGGQQARSLHLVEKTLRPQVLRTAPTSFCKRLAHRLMRISKASAEGEWFG
jgi:hypothetical protein